MAVFPLFYAGNIAYYQALLHHRSDLRFERFEFFPKQTYRNRIEILGPNGLQKLVIPTSKTGNRRRMSDVNISYAENWQKDHWKSLEAAYRRSAYFEFYEHRFRGFYHEQTELLWDFNVGMHRLILDLLGIDLPFQTTDSYREQYENDFRTQSFELNHPKTYLQVFSDRHPFIENLSILDALFNLGPQTRELIS